MTVLDRLTGPALLDWVAPQVIEVYPLVTFYPARYDANSEQLSPDAMMFLSLGGGPGLHGEVRLDRSLITARTIGPQNDYDTGEDMAFTLDAVLLAVDRPATIGAARVLYINRTGGAPE